MKRTILSLLISSILSNSWADKHYDTIIIGGGVAGLSAAKTLHDNQQNVLLIEARNRLGGRVDSTYDWGFAIEMGASWIHGINNNPLVPLIGNRSLILNSYDNSKLTEMLKDFALYNHDGKLINTEELHLFYTLTKEFLRFCKEYNTRKSYEELFSLLIKDKGLNQNQISILHYALDNIYTYEFGEDLDGLSKNVFSPYETSSVSGKNALLPEGYYQLFQGFSENIPIHLNQIVQEINYSGHEVKILTQNNAYYAKKVIITVPLGVLKSNKITFSPNLPDDKLQAIKKLQMGNYEKLYLYFDHVFWDRNKEWIGILPKQKHQAFNIFNYYKYTKKPVLIVFTSGKLAREMEKGNLTNWVMKRLRTIYGEDIPDPIKIKKTHWASDPYTLGSYSYLPIGVDKREIANLAKPVAGRIYFAGEATSDSDPSTVHGAYLSGIRAANEVIANK
ncbi:FAD-dependent oxidoreductase [Legionella waltersii]|uniref:Tryptophan 2-monooxygenase n=1 Tax=Legionella waltersii TaxID=66969 RepID=A0A0W1A199_9GAMM|nr:FAD-dependent oxidoreductase [Legionella waltersii]KTD75108.1 amine oxidase [Legionella waltersii]SNV05056.1 Monoamine oxidase [Legionella waltersii]